MSFSDNSTERAFQTPPGPVQNTTSYAKLANFQAFNHSLPGVPVIYYGEEIGFMGAGDPDNRRPMRFKLNDQEKFLKQEIGNLNKLRGTYPSLSLGDLVLLTAAGPLMAYLKVYYDEVILVVFNQGPDSKRLTFANPLKVRGWEGLENEFKIDVRGDQTAISLPPYSHGYFLMLSEPDF